MTTQRGGIRADLGRAVEALLLLEALDWSWPAMAGAAGVPYTQVLDVTRARNRARRSATDAVRSWPLDAATTATLASRLAEVATLATTARGMAGELAAVEVEPAS